MTTYRFGFERKGRHYNPRPSDNLQGMAEEAARREQDARFIRHLVWQS